MSDLWVPPRQVEEVADPSLFHGAELDAAMDRAAAGPDAMGVCLTAMRSRMDGVVVDQVHAFNDLCGEASLARDLRAKLGREPTEAEVSLTAMRIVLGGAFTYGVHTGVELERGRDRGGLRAVQ